MYTFWKTFSLHWPYMVTLDLDLHKNEKKEKKILVI